MMILIMDTSSPIRKGFLEICAILVVAVSMLGVLFVASYHILRSHDMKEKMMGGSYYSVNDEFLKDFSCRANCYCSTPRKSAVVSKNLIHMFVSAVSIVFATKIAQNRFSEICTTSMKEYCEDDDSAVAEDVICEDKGTKQFAFECNGYCEKNTKLNRKEALDLQDGVDCGRHHIRKTVKYENLEPIPSELRRDFFVGTLHPFCQRVSKAAIKFTHTYKSGKKRGKKKFVSLCAGSHETKKNRALENIVCRKIE